MLSSAAAVPPFNPIALDLVSTCVRNDMQHPQWGFLLHRAWVR